MKIVKTLEFIYDKILDIAYWAVGIGIGFVMISTVAGTFSRYFFYYSLGWTSEISGYVLIPLAWLTAAKMLRDGGHIRVDLINQLFGEKFVKNVSRFSNIAGFVVTLIVFMMAVYVTTLLFDSGAKTDTYLRIPRFYLPLMTTIGLIMISVQYLRLSITGKEKKDSNDSF